MTTLKDFRTWIAELKNFSPLDTHSVMEESGQNDGTDPEYKLSLIIFTRTNKYRITAIEKKGRKKSYLGCIATARTPRAGEDWHRGSDLYDGLLTKDVWHRILADIVSHEMVRIAKGVEHTPQQEQE